MPTTPALCATLLPEVGDLWFSDDHHDQTEAKRHCRRCPIRNNCAQEGLNAGDNARGIWGGLGSGDRRALRKSKHNAPGTDATTPPTRQPCGNNAAYMAHRRLDETCDTCQAAHDTWVTARRRTALDRHHKAGGTAAGRRLHALLGEPSCEACLNAARIDKATSRARIRQAAQAHDAHRTPSVQITA